MYERLKRLYDEGKLTKAQVHWWVGRGITQDEYKAIVGEE